MNRKGRRSVVFGLAVEPGGTKTPKVFRKWDRRRKNRAARRARRVNRGR